MGEEAIIENSRDPKLEIQTKTDALIMDRQDLMKKLEKLRTVVLTAVAENVKMKSNNQTLLERESE
jgi:regulator of replication initiation timing